VDSTTFDARIRSGETLAWIFTAMTFAAGIPLLLPIIALALVLLYRMDKYLFCRYYIQPKKSTSALMLWVLQMLPYAAMLRLAFSIYILSGGGIINTTFPAGEGSDTSAQGYSASVISFDSYNTQVAYLQRQHYLSDSLAFLEERVFKANTLPLFALLVLIVLIKITLKTWNYLPPVVLGRLAWAGIKHLLGHNRFRASKKEGFIHPYDLTFHNPDPLRNQEASLSGRYCAYFYVAVGSLHVNC